MKNLHRSPKGFLLLLIFASFFGSHIYSKSKTEVFLRQNDFEGFLNFCNNDVELAIEHLAFFNLSDTIGRKYVWYCESSGRRIPLILKSTYGGERNHTSLKLKSFYWSILIFGAPSFSFSVGDICYFYDDSGRMLYDYQAIDLERQNEFFSQKLHQKSEGNDGLSFEEVFIYARNNTPDVEILYERFASWYKKISCYGIEEMRKRNVWPISDANFKIMEGPNLLEGINLIIDSPQE